MALKGIFYALLAGFCFGIMPIITKLIYGQTGVDPFFFLMIRYSLAAISLWSYIGLRRDTSWMEIKTRQLVLIGAASLCYILVTSAYFIALKYIDASLNSLLVFTFPVFTPFLGCLFFKVKISWIQVLSAITGFLGCLLVIGDYRLKGVPGEILGIGLGLGSGLIYAFYTIFGQKVTVRMNPLTVTAYNISIVALFFIITRFNWLWEHPQPFQVYLAAGIIGIISTVFANNFYFSAIKILGAVKASIFSSIEPLFTAALAIIFLQERMGLWQWFGAVLIITAMIVVEEPWKRQTAASAVTANRDGM